MMIKAVKVYFKKGIFTIVLELIKLDGKCVINILESNIDGLSGSFIANDYFESLNNLRLYLESFNIQIAINGAREDVFSSGMARQMGSGMKAYELKKDKLVDSSDLVDTFEDYLNLNKLVTVKEQKESILNWYKRL